jgi:transposase
VFVTGIVDLTGRPRLLDVVPQRTGNALSAWISAQSRDWRDRVGVAALDPFRGYASALSALSASLPHATRVLDAFHVTRLGLTAVDDVRRRVQQQRRRSRAGSVKTVSDPGSQRQYLARVVVGVLIGVRAPTRSAHDVIVVT